jgi:hypothetical protein
MATKNIDIIIRAKDQASKELGGVSSSLDGVKSKAAGAAKAGVIALGALTAAAATASVALGFKFNNSLEQAETKLMAFTQDAGKTAEVLAWVKKEAAATQFSFTDMADAAAMLTPVSKQTGVALEDLVRQAEVLAAINPSQGLTGAVFSLREALGNDWISITDRFNLPRVRINELKQQGIPAMQAISQVLKEMGIDYSLVAAQGKTASARFDQIKDKLQMLAGAATEPIFEGVSNQLDKLANGGDWDSLIAKTEVLSREALAWLGDAFRKVTDAARAVFEVLREYLGPSLSALWNTMQNDLFPVLKEAWRILEPVLVPVIKALAIVIGVNLVSALWVLINALNVVIKTVSWVANQFMSLQKTVWNAGASMVDAFNGAVQRLKNIMTQVRDFIAAPFNAAYEAVKDLPQKMVDLFSGVGGMIRSAIGNIDIPGPLGKIKDVIPGFATGTRSAPGGLAVVGERGPELVNLPRGSRVYNATQTADMVGGVTQHNTFNVYNQTDLEASIRELGWRLAVA